MPIEIERKYLLKSDQWKKQVYKSVTYQQGYLANNKRASVRIRIADDHANINIKSMTLGIHRQEYEYEIPLNEAQELLQLCEKPLIEKTRHFVKQYQKIWEIDVFTGDNAGLIVAEVELDDINEVVKLPEWIAKEVTQHKRYYNVHLIQYPYKDWMKTEK